MYINFKTIHSYYCSLLHHIRSCMLKKMSRSLKRESTLQVLNLMRAKKAVACFEVNGDSHRNRIRKFTTCLISVRINLPLSAKVCVKKREVGFFYTLALMFLRSLRLQQENRQTQRSWTSHSTRTWCKKNDI